MAENKIKSPLLRDYWFDNVKAFLIICVVVGHLANGLFSTTTWWVIALQNFIYVFHMPVFMIVSGRFVKKRIDKGDWATVVSKMIIPYIIFQTAFLILYSALDKGTSKFTYLSPLFGLWYFVNVGVYTIATTHLKKVRWLFPLSIVLALAIGLCDGSLYGGFHRIITFYPFFLFGYMTAGMKLDFCKKIPFRALSCLIFIVIGIYVLLNFRQEWNIINFELLCLNENYVGIEKEMGWGTLETLCHAALRYLVGFVSFFMVMGMLPTKKTFFSYVGSNSVYVYVLHCMLIVILRDIDAEYDILGVLDNKLKLLIYCFSGIPLSFILASKPVRKLTRWFIAPDIDISRMVKRLAGIEETQTK